LNTTKQKHNKAEAEQSKYITNINTAKHKHDEHKHNKTET